VFSTRTALHQQDDDAPRDEGDRHRHGSEQLRLDETAEEQPQHRRREKCDEQVAPELQVDSEEPRAVLPHHRQHRASLDRNEEHAGAFPAQAEQVARQDQVPGAGDRQELGKALDNAEDQRVQQARIHAA